ncbi:hypothetical protein B9Q12_01140 [Candidatus Marsarchaeota G2 archaeon ECH_B_SAG-G06]|uniref:ABC transmembrane type-1 domain-containing protein n=1 Tax=Candidatus Marsarchaeota G2 archaeon ECH_B_SAG-G06 TaxID=1978166 RepID=A0A2R6C2N5_9ARCH|nr:MAG: hypothetical protein B9Q12_01140 [Candidatus Marsarchaeota G2 archaeon ECH_B_SAG-G06]
MHLNRGIAKYIAKRLALLPLTIFSVITIDFVLIHLAPGGPFQILLSDPSFSPQEVATLQEEYGLNKPLLIQYFTYIYQVLHGNFGISYFYGVPVIRVIMDYLPNTLVLAGFSILVSSAIGILFGILSTSLGGLIDRALNTLAILSYTLPVFWFGILLILLPSTGVYVSNTGFNLAQYLKHIIMPTLSLSLLLYPPVYFFTRSSMLEVAQANFVRALYGKGLSEGVVFRKHVLRNALLPVITVIGLHGAVLFGGATIVEIVFT